MIKSTMIMTDVDIIQIIIIQSVLAIHIGKKYCSTNIHDIPEPYFNTTP